jgi:hypothetical protein
MREDNHRDNPEEPRPILNRYYRGALLRFVSSSLSELSNSACELRDWAYRYHTPEGWRERERMLSAHKDD